MNVIDGRPAARPDLDGHWTAVAACGSDDVSPDALFVEGPAQREARSVCMGCQVRLECLADALDNRMNFGVWGGMTERERRQLLRRRPEVSSWRSELVDVRDAAELVAP
ncbi:WhiB family transcriptional regulator [Cellulomonas sp. HZM]|uniref:WhiB family transcriptional regulator n=1 Tax=Cellulomonas sp. HZM TaxID=1454010 RepID=UPI00068C0653|nr:WhiB family transcriptional regulator [Cellulomonas sp. HZM]